MIDREPLVITFAERKTKRNSSKIKPNYGELAKHGIVRTGKKVFKPIEPFEPLPCGCRICTFELPHCQIVYNGFEEANCRVTMEMSQ